MTQPMPRFLVDAPTVTAWRYGLRSVATLVQNGPDDSEALLRWTARGVEYETVQCYDVREWLGDACTQPTTARTVTVTFTAAPSGGDTVLSAAATVDSGAARQLSIAVEAAAPVAITTGAAAAPVYTQSPSAAATLDVIITDTATGAVLNHQVTVSLAGAVTAGGTAQLDVADPILKTFTDSWQMVGGPAWTLYAEDGCKIIGETQAAANRATGRLEAGEQEAIERVAMALVIAPGAVDLTTIAAGHAIKQALGLLEAYAAANYGGMATLHVPRSMAPYLANIAYVYRDGPVLRTPLDTSIALGGGYTGQISPDVPSVAPAAGKFWVYITGQPVLRQTAINIPAPTPARGGANLARNQLTVVAERTYALTVDCLRAGILIDLTTEG